MAGTIKVDSINADSNLALKIANTAVAFIDATGLRPTSGNVNLDATATSKLYLSSANTVAIQTAGVTAVTVDVNLNVGIGTTSPGAPIDVVSNSAAIGTRIRGRSADSYGVLEFTNNSASAETARIAADTSGNIIFSNTGSVTERMRIDSSGNVGIGTTSPETKLQITASNSGGMGASILLDNPSTSALGSGNQIAFTNDAGASFAGVCNVRLKSLTTTAVSGAAAFTITTFDGSAEGERMRIDSSGHVLVRTTTSTNFQDGISLYSASQNSQLLVGHGNGAPSGNYYAAFYYNTNTIGTITQNGTTAVAYNTSSDYRLKENIAPLTGALNKVSQLKPVSYTWKASPEEMGEGFIAHELAEVCPQAVHGTKDEVDADGNPKYQGIDTSFLVATLTAAIQELKAINDTQAETINALTANLTALTARITALESTP